MRTTTGRTAAISGLTCDLCLSGASWRCKGAPCANAEGVSQRPTPITAHKKNQKPARRAGRPTKTHVSKHMKEAIEIELTNGQKKSSLKKRLEGQSAPSRRAIREIEKKD